jgi:hypothetical protein
LTARSRLYLLYNTNRPNMLLLKIITVTVLNDLTGRPHQKHYKMLPKHRIGNKIKQRDGKG